jgi:hypothetical protein
MSPLYHAGYEEPGKPAGLLGTFLNYKTAQDCCEHDAGVTHGLKWVPHPPKFPTQWVAYDEDTGVNYTITLYSLQF